MKAIELIIIIAQVSDAKQFIKVLIDSPKVSAADKEKYQEQVAVLETVLQVLHGFVDKYLNKRLTKSPFNEYLSLNEDETSTLKQLNETILKIRKDNAYEKIITQLMLFRHLFFEFISTEKEFVDSCHEITEEKAQEIIVLVKIFYSKTPIVQEKFLKLAPLLHAYRGIKNHLDINIQQALNFAGDFYQAIEFLYKQVASIDEDYDTLEHLTLHYRNLYDLIAEASRGLANVGAYSDFLRPFELILSKPFQRTARYPLFFKEVLKDYKLTELAKLYQEHEAANSQKLNLAITHITNIAKQLEKNITKINEKIRQMETQAEQVKRIEARDHFLAIQKNLESLRSEGVVKTQQPRSILGLLSHYTNHLNLELLAAAREGDHKTVISALEKGADINARDSGMIWGNYTALVAASYHGHTKIVSALLNVDLRKYPLDTRAQTHTFKVPYNTALHWAARQGHLEIARMLVLVDPELAMIHSKENGFIPLHFAITENRQTVAQLLLKEVGVKQIIIEDAKHKSCFVHAFEKKQYQIIELMIELLLAEPEKYAIEIELLKEYLFGVKKIPKRFIGLLYAPMNEVNANFLNAAKIGDLAKLTQAHKAGASINIRDVSEEYANCTPLIHASLGGHVACVEYLLKHKADVRAQDYSDNSALHYAATSGNNEIVTVLSVTDPTTLLIREKKCGHIPLHNAIKANKLSTGQILLNCLARNQLKQTLNDGVTTPLRLACELGNREFAQVLFTATVSTNDQVLINEAVSYLLLRMKFELLKKQSAQNSDQLLKQLHTATAGELVLLNKLLHKYPLKSATLQEFTLGNQIFLHDNGASYTDWQDYDQNLPHSSNLDHSSLDHKLSISGALLGECVVGTTIVDDNKTTWLHCQSLSTELLTCLADYDDFVARLRSTTIEVTSLTFWNQLTQSGFDKQFLAGIQRYFTAETTPLPVQQSL